MSVTRASWLVPAMMVSSTICGALLAVGHHLFYQSLNTQTVGDQNQQEWNVRIGTGIAFCVKMFLVGAAGLAYTQLLWKTLKAREVKLEGIDAMFDIAHDPWGFFNLELWKRGFELVVLAGMLWAIPIIAVFTPATLTVEQAKDMTATAHRVALPSVNYSSPVLFAKMSGFSKNSSPKGPSIALDRLISSVATLGTILPVPRPIPNAPKASYNMRFPGPSVSCGLMGGSDSFREEYDKGYILARNHIGNSFLLYTSFTPTISNTEDGTTLENTILQGLSGVTNTSFPVVSPLDSSSSDHCRLFVVLPDVERNQSAADGTIECGLYNSVYEAQFTFINDTQEVDIKVIERGDGVTSRNTSSDVHQLTARYIMSGLGDLLTGYIIEAGQGDLSFTSKILSTAFVQAREVRSMLSAGTGVDKIEVDPSLPTTNISLAKLMEQFVANVTVSLFSNKYFMSNDLTAHVGDVTAWSPTNIYIYNPRNLYIAYGIGIFTTAVMVAIGLFCVVKASHSHGKSFSTILRTTRGASLDELLNASETSGAEPLPERLAKTRLKFRSHRLTHGSSTEYSAFVVAYNENGTHSSEVTVVTEDTAQHATTRLMGDQKRF